MQNHKSYNEDFYGWAYEQANLIRNGDFKNMDISNLIEEIECLGRSEGNKLESHLTNILLHKLKIKYQPYLHGRSWDFSIKNSTKRAIRQLKKNPSLKSSVKEMFKDAYDYAVDDACKETGMEEDTFPKECPWSIEEILGSNAIK